MRTLLAGIVLAATASVALAGTSAPALRIADRDPLVVRAAGFEAGERVVVRASGSDGVARRVVRASRAGSFTVRFDAIYDYCLGVNLVRADGAKSGTVRLRPAKRFCVYPD
jgi:hypothetical protein